MTKARTSCGRVHCGVLTYAQLHQTSLQLWAKQMQKQWTSLEMLFSCWCVLGGILCAVWYDDICIKSKCNVFIQWSPQNTCFLFYFNIFVQNKQDSKVPATARKEELLSFITCQTLDVFDMLIHSDIQNKSDICLASWKITVLILYAHFSMAKIWEGTYWWNRMSTCTVFFLHGLNNM